MVQGALAWFSAIAIAAVLYGMRTGFVARDGRAISAAGFAVIAFGSLAFTPASDRHLRPNVRSDRRSDPEYERLNVLITLIWAVAFGCIATSHLVAASLGSAGASTVFNWVVPIALVTVAVYRTRMSWNDFNDDDPFEPHPMPDLDLDWRPPPFGSTDA